MTQAMRSNTLEIEGLHVHVLEAGEGAPVLFIHGWPTNAQLWRHTLLKLAPGTRGIAIDLPPFGGSSKPLDLRYNSDFYKKIFDGALAQLGVDKLGLCVHDAGGPIGLRWAVDRAERIDSLCLLNTLVFPELSWAVRAFFASSRLPAAHQLMGHPRSVELGMRMGVRSRSLDADTLDLYKKPFEPTEARHAYLKAMRSLDLKVLDEISERLDVFSKTPLRLLYGARDVILPDVADTMRRVKQRLPQAELTELPALGHFLQEDDPEQVASLVAEFFARRAHSRRAAIGAPTRPAPINVIFILNSMN
jgi:haloalkane dehalogenase